ncbi:MAG: hypothetical protein ACLTBF_09660 [Christensenellales bacterium]
MARINSALPASRLSAPLCQRKEVADACQTANAELDDPGGGRGFRQKGCHTEIPPGKLGIGFSFCAFFKTAVSLFDARGIDIIKHHAPKNAKGGA